MTRGGCRRQAPMEAHSEPWQRLQKQPVCKDLTRHRTLRLCGWRGRARGDRRQAAIHVTASSRGPSGARRHAALPRGAARCEAEGPAARLWRRGCVPVSAQRSARPRASFCLRRCSACAVGVVASHAHQLEPCMRGLGAVERRHARWSRRRYDSECNAVSGATTRCQAHRCSSCGVGGEGLSNCPPFCLSWVNISKASIRRQHFSNTTSDCLQRAGHAVPQPCQRDGTRMCVDNSE